jgi:hypothetical protein
MTGADIAGADIAGADMAGDGAAAGGEADGTCAAGVAMGGEELPRASSAAAEIGAVMTTRLSESGGTGRPPMVMPRASGQAVRSFGPAASGGIVKVSPRAICFWNSDLPLSSDTLTQTPASRAVIATGPCGIGTGAGAGAVAARFLAADGAGTFLIKSGSETAGK